MMWNYTSVLPEIFELWVSSDEEPPHLIRWPKTAWSPGWHIQPEHVTHARFELHQCTAADQIAFYSICKTLYIFNSIYKTLYVLRTCKCPALLATRCGHIPPRAAGPTSKSSFRHLKNTLSHFEVSLTHLTVSSPVQGDNFNEHLRPFGKPFFIIVQLIRKIIFLINWVFSGQELSF